jgi:hypothetical protein
MWGRIHVWSRKIESESEKIKCKKLNNKKGNIYFFMKAIHQN